MFKEELTECELLVMKVIWHGDEVLSIQEITSQLNQMYKKDWKVQTVSTFLGRAVKKEYLSMKRQGRLFYYYPLVSENEYGKREIAKCVDFWGNGKVDEYRKWFGIENVELLRNDLIKSPITCGGRRKRIILPFPDYSEKQLHIIFEHEFNHIARHDLFWRKLAFVTTWVHWFNPFVYKELRDIIYMEEIICDDLSSKGKTWFSQKEYAGFKPEHHSNR